MKTKLLSFGLVFLLFSGSILAQIPQTFTYHGKLTNTDGSYIDGNHNITFKLYQLETGGIPVWMELHSIAIENGNVDVLLGNITPLDIQFDSEYWLAISIDNGTELTPRTPLTSVPYSLNSKSIMLPYSSSITSNSDAFSVTNSGSGRAAYFGGEVTSTGIIETLSGGFRFPDGNIQEKAFRLPFSSTTSESKTAFEIKHTDNSTVAAFIQEGTGSGSEALLVRTYGQSEAVVIDVENSTNNADALFVITSGAGKAGFFRIANANNSDITFKASTNGTGNAGLFEINNTSNSNDALRVVTNGTGGAAFFEGDVQINGTLSKSSGTFVIDHPLNPENWVLSHSFVESPEMTNIYKGRSKLAEGSMTINLPDYFDALNHPDGREINLTSINGWSPLYLDGKIKGNRFIVKTTREGNQEQEFSWVIYGVRNDNYAKMNPIIVEQEKGKNNRFKKGKLLNPKVFSQGKQK